MKKHSHKAAAALALTALLGLTACSSDGGGSQDSISLWLPTLASDDTVIEEEAWAEILAPFEAEHDVKVNVTITPWSNYEEKYLTGISSGAGPDVGYMYNEMMGDYIDQGAIVPFDEYLTADALPDHNYLEQGQVDGQQYALPFVVGGARIIYVNQDILDEAGVTELPETWDDYLAASAQIAAAGFTPTAQPWGASDRGMLAESFIPLLWQAGGELFTEDGSATAFNSPEGIEAATFIKTLLDEGYMASNVSGLNADETRQQFLNGDVAFYLDSESWKGEVDAAGINVSVIDSLMNVEQGTFIATDSLVLMDACDDKQLCTDLVTFIESGPQMEQFHKWADYPPIGSDETVESDNELISLYTEGAEILRPFPVVTGSSAVYNSLYQNLQQMVLGQKTPEQALSDAAKDGDAALNSAG
ncbi:ABC transporter substrate-binding protein [Humidisolicoccus flavus]|uniref:ABC transporter substrate-binding protein n=1 Tax=Humidisolicoccus flavus TaxID=3111414 RepID=UPI00325602C2